MTYLDIFRDARKARKGRTEEEATLAKKVPDCEKSETSEKRSEPALLAPEEAELLKARIVTVATAEPDVFDRAELDRLWAMWTAHEAAG